MTTIQSRIKIINKEIQSLQESITSSEKYIAINRHDRDAVIDAQEDITKYESQILSLTMERMRLLNMLQTVRTPKVNPEKKLSELRASYAKLEERADKLQDMIFNCKINMDSSQRSSELISQSECELTTCHEEYIYVSAQMDKIAAEIKVLEARTKNQKTR